MIISELMPKDLKRSLDLSLSLDNCMRYLFNEMVPQPHNALQDAKCVQRICDELSAQWNPDSKNPNLEDFLYQNQRFIYPFGAKFM